MLFTEVQVADYFYYNIMIAEPGFWPKGIKCRPWVTKAKYNASHKMARKQGQYSNYNDYDDYQHYDQGHNSYDNDKYEEYDQYTDSGMHY